MLRSIITVVSGICVALAATAEIHRGLGPSPDTLDIHQAQGLSSFNLLRDLHEGLLTRDAHGRAVPAVARRWEVSEDGLRWIFELDPEARWSNGSAITAEDFLRSFRRARAPDTASPTANWLAPISSVRAPARDRLEIELSRPIPWFEELLTLPATFPYPAGGKALFSGAYQLQRRVPGSRFELARNPHYRQAASVPTSRIVWHVTEDPSAELARFRAGELHITESVPPGRHDWLEAELGPSLRIAPYLGSFYLVFNLARPPFENARDLRAALSLAIDREIIVERVLGSGELPAERLVPPGMPGWPGSGLTATGEDPADRIAHARSLYDKAGFGPNRPLVVELRFNSSLLHRRVAVAVAAMWKQHLGVRTRVINEEWKVFVTNRRQGRITELVRGGWIADWADPGNFLDNFYSMSPLNYAFYRDEAFDRLIDSAADHQGHARTEILWRAEQHLLDDQVIIPLYYYVSRHLVRPEISGFEDNLMDIHLSRWLELDR
ncbi:MAG: peptide ABC transporter substrate-binding protein [Wenzhouxiangellaceae bacterium]|nr:peptide ABC transporter substrate-binding protein [Wenzhouxiangellaceae bacterium]